MASSPSTGTDVRTGLDADALRRDILQSLYFCTARFPEVATKNDWYLAVAYAVRDRLLQRWLATAQTYYGHQSRTVCYLSAEFLLGPHLGNAVLNMGFEPALREALGSLGKDYDEICAAEEEPGLGNGGLGRLAACFMESLATLDIPAIGYGIRYEFGIFDQELHDGVQVEITDAWLRLGNPWEIARPEIAFDIGFGGTVEHVVGTNGELNVVWKPERFVRAIAYDTPIIGHDTHTASLLRLWKAEGLSNFDFQSFNAGDYVGAVMERVVSENVTKVLYPNDETAEGKRLRLQQQYFFVSASLKDMLRLQRQKSPDAEGFERKFVVQLNDTHPSIGVAELMRLLVDEQDWGWDRAWKVTKSTFAYTNHTLLPEALEKWPVALFQSLLPRHLEIIYELNRRFLDEVRESHPGDDDLLRRVSLIDEAGTRAVRMAHLATLGSFSVNGVAALHSDLLAKHVLADFHRLRPGLLRNVTNGVTPRRFLALCNPGLAALLTEVVGEGWLKDMSRLKGLEAVATDKEFQKRWRAVKLDRKERLARVVLECTGVDVDPAAMMDVQVKRIHEYKRQHLNLLHVLWLYLRLKNDLSADASPRTVLLAGKAAPGYRAAKLIIRLASCVADLVNRDPAMKGRLRVVFFPNFNVKNGMFIYPAADLSEQISTAGKEASGTGNMKLAMNGALTMGTLDGANVEIRDHVGEENFFLFGHDVDGIAKLRSSGWSPNQVLEQDPELRAVLELITSRALSHHDPELFRPIVSELVERDQYFLLADFRSYVEAQSEAGRIYDRTEEWTRRSILSTARMGFFSSDRSIADYARTVWQVEPVRVALPNAAIAP
ncbi:MAG: glycogen/starch/alpha-glucan phosphorylase [Planctomycetes bacterium]|nr:glycogen/starch/alpha-glucan phosphorylase [Planctomycetota bacterium]